MEAILYLIHTSEWLSLSCWGTWKQVSSVVLGAASKGLHLPMQTKSKEHDWKSEDASSQYLSSVVPIPHHGCTTWTSTNRTTTLKSSVQNTQVKRGQLSLKPRHHVINKHDCRVFIEPNVSQVLELLKRF